MGSFEDEAWWSVKYDQDPACDEHGQMYYDEGAEEWRCSDCEEIEVTYRYG